jgi:hypothetical protein
MDCTAEESGFEYCGSRNFLVSLAFGVKNGPGTSLVCCALENTDGGQVHVKRSYSLTEAEAEASTSMTQSAVEWLPFLLLTMEASRPNVGPKMGLVT